MDYKLLKQFRFWDTIEAAVMKETYNTERRDSLYPSEASVVSVNPTTGRAKILGGCMRKSWYRLHKFSKSEKLTMRSMVTFGFGNAIESMITNWAKMAGIYDSNNVKFFDRSSGVSGEIDLICQVPINKQGYYIHTEIKSTWGGPSKHLWDHYEGRGKNKKFVKAYPKESALLQLTLYLFTHKDDERLAGGKIIYLLKDNSNRTEFDVTIEEQENGKHRIMMNGIIDESFYVEDIYARYSEIATKINSDVQRMRAEGITKEDLDPPERDFDLVYSNTKAVELFDNGDLAKTRYEKHIGEKTDAKGKISKCAVEKTGDWQCSYVTMAGTIAI